MKAASKRAALGATVTGLLAAFVLAGCPTDPPAAGTSLSVQGTAPGALASMIGARSASIASRAVGDPIVIPVAGGDISLDTVRLVLKEFEIEKEGEDADGSSFEFAGPYVVDLIAGTIDPSPGNIDLAPGTYDEIKFKIDKIEGDETDDTGSALLADTDPLFGHSILIEGSFTPTGLAAIPFSFVFDEDADFELKAPGDTAAGFAVTDTDASDIIIAFRLSKWFDGIDPALFAADPQAFADDLKDNIELSADYGKDADDDGVLGSDEDDDPDAEDTEDD